MLNMPGFGPQWVVWSAVAAAASLGCRAPLPPGGYIAEPALAMAALSHGSGAEQDAALRDILEANDRRFVPVLIELLRAKDWPEVADTALDRAAVADALEQLTGESLGTEWHQWMTWSYEAGYEPPPGFATWKGRLLEGVDPAFRQWLDDGVDSRIPVEHIQWGGVKVDGIPALDQPETLAAAEATYLNDGDPIVGVVINGEARAYPTRIIDWHEMVNDTVGGVPIALAYCTLCGAAIPYDARRGGGEPFVFASSGLLYKSNKLMFDRQTKTLWNQLTGEPVLGPLAGPGQPLATFPVVTATWGDWRADHPETRVLSPNTGHRRPYEPGAAYGDYFASGGTMFPIGPVDERLPMKAWVYGLRAGDAARAYPVEALTRERVVNDALGGTAVVLIAPRAPIESASRRRDPYAAGAEVRAYLRGPQTFRAGESAGTVLDEPGASWRVTESALEGPGGERLERLPGHLAYWFAWSSFHPETTLYGDG